MRFQLALNKTCSIPPLLTHRQLKHCHKTNINITLSAFLSFLRKVHNVIIEKQINILPQQLSNQDRYCRSPPIRLQNFMSPLILNTNFIKRETKIGYPQGSNSGPPLWLYAVIIVDWEPAQESPRSCKCSSTNNEASLEFYIPIHKVLEQPCWHFTSLKLHKCSQIPHPQQHQPPVEQKPITIGLTIYKHSTCTKFRVSFQSLRLTQGNLGFSLLTPKIKR